MVNAKDVLTSDCADYMDRLLSHFKEGLDTRVTVAIRTPGKPEGDFLMTSDDLNSVIEMVERRRAAGPTS